MNVDRVEDDFVMVDLLNNKVVENLVVVVVEIGVMFIYVFIDYVFWGDKNIFCCEFWEIDLLGVYGKIKLVGE